MRFGSRALQHFFGNIDANDSCRCILARPSTEPAKPASEIDDFQAAHVRKHRAQGWPFGRTVQPIDGTRQAAVFLEECIIIVDVLCHCTSSKPKRDASC